jgi:cyclopropane-fatty-acyl-phospholipid synthase
MTDLALRSRSSTRRPARGRLDTAAFPARARWVLQLLERIDIGALDVIFPDGQRALYGRLGARSGAESAHGSEPRADLRLANWNVFEAALKRGDVGFAEGFIDGDWTTSDPLPLLRFILRNRAAVERVVYGSFLGRLTVRLRHLARTNTRAQARRNIHAHYDLGNAFYALWLDPTMTYSSALFKGPFDPARPAGPDELMAAQQVKYDRVLHALALPAGARVLEIGCGWGGFAHTAAAAGHAVTGVTLSAAQLAYGRERLARAGLRADLRLQDYRDLRETYDGVASIEMFEAVGERYWATYFATLSRCLAPGGRACLQTITIDDAHFERYRTGTDFIQQYVFPGGMLPSRGAFERAAQRAGLRIEEAFGFGPHYGRTLATWRARFNAQLAAVRALGFDERFIRTWDFYLAYCEAAFAEGSTDVVQFTLVRR